MINRTFFYCTFSLKNNFIDPTVGKFTYIITTAKMVKKTVQEDQSYQMKKSETKNQFNKNK